MDKVLLLGAGNSRIRKLRLRHNQPTDFNGDDVTTVDIDEACNPTLLFDLNALTEGDPLPFEAGTFDEIHAYEVLEHIGRQGDWQGFFLEFKEYHRLLKPGGHFFISVPHWSSMWAWGDPGHTRVLNEGTLVFLSQEQYVKQIGKTAMTDYRSVWPVDYNFNTVFAQKQGENLFVILQKEKYHG